MRTDLSSDAIRLTRALHHSVPDDAEIMGLLALMLLTDARRPARVNEAAILSRSPSRNARHGTAG